MKIIILILLLVQPLLARDLLITWTAPTQREDNTPLLLSEIGKFNIYYGTVSGDYQDTIAVDLNFATSYEIINPPKEDLYFVLTTVDTDGRESVYSTEVFFEFIEGIPESVENIRIYFGSE